MEEQYVPTLTSSPHFPLFLRREWKQRRAYSGLFSISAFFRPTLHDNMPHSTGLKQSWFFVRYSAEESPQDLKSVSMGVDSLSNYCTRSKPTFLQNSRYSSSYWLISRPIKTLSAVLVILKQHNLNHLGLPWCFFNYMHPCVRKTLNLYASFILVAGVCSVSMKYNLYDFFSKIMQK